MEEADGVLTELERSRTLMKEAGQLSVIETMDKVFTHLAVATGDDEVCQLSVNKLQNVILSG